MIILRLSSIGNKKGDFEIDIQNGELLSSAMERACEPLNLQRDIAEVFQVLVNGHKITAELWPFTRLASSDTVLIAPHMKSGDSGSIIKSLILIAVTVYTGGLVAASTYGGTVAGSLIVAGATIATGLILNALIPPPVDNSNKTASADIEKSQTYSISGQSNNAQRYATVPKVYGAHRMFPNVAANPYIELEVDQGTKKIVQVLYAVYDFGLGPLTVKDLKIGDTSIFRFSDVTFNLVDTNKPAISEGYWDDPLKSSFELYRGDVEVDASGYSLDVNQTQSGEPGIYLDDYQVVRETAANIDGAESEITLTFAFSRGLYAYSANGEIGNRSVDIQVEFQPEAETSTWYGYNDINYVSSYNLLGVDIAYSKKGMDLIPPDPGGPTFNAYSFLPAAPSVLPAYWGWMPTAPSGTVEVGLKKGQGAIVAKKNLASIGSHLFVKGEFVGVVVSTSPYGTEYSWYYLDRVLTKDFPLYTFNWKYVGAYSYDSAGYVNSVSGILQSVTPIPGRVRATEASTDPCYVNVKFTPKTRGKFRVRLTRVQSMSEYTHTTTDEMTFSGVMTRFNRPPIVTDKRHVFLEIKIRATNQLNGSISNLSGVASSVLDSWNGSAWVKKETNNPAWVFVDLLTGQVNKRAISKDKLHVSSLYEWSLFCDQIPTPPPGSSYITSRFTSNFILDYDATLQQALNQVSSAAQASLNSYDGKYGVLIDKLKTTPVQVFTPRNSWGFSSTKSFTEKPHYLKIKYIDPAVNWKPTELEVYDDGYTAANSTISDELTAFACTNHEQAWRFGRYMLAQNRLRQETISITVDFENLVCTRGDYVQITQDVMKAGGTPARVKSITGNRVILDDAMDTGPLSYGYVFRSKGGTIYTNTLSVVSADTFDLNGATLPQEGDLIIIGEVGFITYDCIVKAISPSDDFTATLTLVEKADAIYSAESLTTIPVYDPKISQTVDPNFAPPGEVLNLSVTDNDWECTGSGYHYFISLDWGAPSGSAYEQFEIYVDSGNGYNLVTTTRESEYKYTVKETALGKVHNFKILAVSATGKKLDIGSVSAVTATPLSKTSPPSNVTSLNIDITGETLQLVWPQVLDCDCNEYLVRYSPTTSGTWETSVPLLRLDRNTTLANTQARTGTYLIKAVDFNGNESTLAATAITTIPNLFGLNIIDEISDFPLLEGNKDQVKLDGAALTLDNKVVGGITTSEYYSEGFYYYQNFLNLGEIFTVRLQSLIQAEGFTLEDIMSNWVTLDTVLYMSNSKFSEWDVELQYRATEALNVMSEWVSLDLVDPINAGQEDVWTEWRKIAAITDATGRIFQFRLRLISNKVSVSPRIFEAIVKADMPDRIDSYNNLTATSGGYTLSYSPAFMGPGTTPNVQISIDNAQSGDYWVFTSKTLSGFTIVFYDKTDAAVARQFDCVAKGYGRKALNVI